MIFFKHIFTNLLLVSFTLGQCLYPEDSLIGNFCYSFPRAQLNFEDASTYCAGKNQDLAIIENAFNANFLSNLMRIKIGSEFANFWIGLSRPSTLSSYHWNDGTSLTWSNFDPNVPQRCLYVVQSTSNGKWHSLDGTEQLFFVCSYVPGGLTVTPTVLPTTLTTVPPLCSVTCLIMYDTQSAGDSAGAIAAYKTYYTFAQLIGSKLSQRTIFTGYLDNFGYSDNLNDHSHYETLNNAGFQSIPFPISSIGDDIDLDLTDVDGSLSVASWIPPTQSSTCLIFMSAASADLYGGTTIKTTYDHFETVVGVLLGEAISIPGLSDSVVAAGTMTDADAEAVVNKLLSILSPNSQQ